LAHNDEGEGNVQEDTWENGVMFPLLNARIIAADVEKEETSRA